MDEINEITKEIKESSPLVQYLLISQTLIYLGASLPTAALIYILGRIIIKNRPKNKKEPEPGIISIIKTKLI